MSGWVKLHRAIWDHPFFDAEPMSEREAFLWLVSRAAHAPTRHRTQSGMATVARGSLFVTLRGLATEWRWKSEKRVRTFLGRLENEGMIGRSADAAKEHNKTQITICNYEKFQDHGRSADAAETQDGRSADALKKNVKKEEERKNPPTPRKRGGDPEGFDAFWAAYPRREARGDAVKAYAAALAKTTPEAIADGARRYAKAAAGKEPQFVKLPAGWLRGERWADGGAPSAKQAADEHYRMYGCWPDSDPRNPFHPDNFRNKRRQADDGDGGPKASGHHDSPQSRHIPNDLPQVQPCAQEKARPLPFCDVVH